MTENAVDAASKTIRADEITPGIRVMTPGGASSAPVREIQVQDDDFGTPALVLATFEDDSSLRIAAGSMIRVATGTGRPADVLFSVPEPPANPPTAAPPAPAVSPEAGAGTDQQPAAELALIPAPEGNPEDIVAEVAARHPAERSIEELADRLAKGVNLKSGACLKDLRDLAYALYIDLEDPEGALTVADLLTVLPYDGNPGRWASIEGALALASYITAEQGEPERSAAYDALLHASEEPEEDAFKARVSARVRQRALNEPNLYDKEVFRSIDNGDHAAERDWRLLRLGQLLFLRAHGGSRSYTAEDLARRIGNELAAVRR